MRGTCFNAFLQQTNIFFAEKKINCMSSTMWILGNVDLGQRESKNLTQLKKYN